MDGMEGRRMEWNEMEGTMDLEWKWKMTETTVSLT